MFKFLALILACTFLPGHLLAEEVLKPNQILAPGVQVVSELPPHMRMYNKGIKAIKPAQEAFVAYKKLVVIGHQLSFKLKTEVQLRDQRLYKRIDDNEADRRFFVLYSAVEALQNEVHKAREKAKTTLSELRAEVMNHNRMLIKEIGWEEYYEDFDQIVNNETVDKALSEAKGKAIGSLASRAMKAPF